MFYFWWNAFLGGILFVIGGSDLRELCQSDEQCQVMSNNSGCKFDRGIGICTCQEGYEEVTTTKGKYCLLGNLNTRSCWYCRLIFLPDANVKMKLFSPTSSLLTIFVPLFLYVL
ncbi:uncharacterized protein LOC143255610 isoform X12 [Tachypleus tridentatus]|uniref:uncharacterized protein LOC143255610 isoform X12 n=1 Tax=Tachypleus tridentatus TaxID=6853 RepID=UPI003FD4CCFB